MEEFSVCRFGKARAVRDKVDNFELGIFKFKNLNTIFFRAISGVNAAGDIEELIGGEILTVSK